MCTQHQLSEKLTGEQLLMLLHCAKVWLEGRHYENRSRF